MSNSMPMQGQNQLGQLYNHVKSKYNMRVPLSRPIKFEDKEYKELKLDLESLNGEDIIAASNESKLMGDTYPVSEMSKTYLAVLAAKAAKVPTELILQLSAKDFTLVTMVVQDFLFQ